MIPESRQLLVVYKQESFRRGFGTFLSQTWQSRSILMSFIRKELKIRYRESILGILWALVKPLTQLFIYGVVLGIFLGFGKSIPYFPLYILTGLIIMAIFNESSTQGATAIIRGAPLIKKVAFRREMLPIASVGGALVNSFFQFLALCVGYALTRTLPNFGSLAIAIPALLIVVLLATGTAILLSALNVYLRDTQFILDVGLMVLFWITPILYPWHTVQENLAEAGFPAWFFDAYMLNPLANSVVAFRQAFWPGIDTPEGASYVYFSGPLDLRLWLMVAGCAAFVWLSQRIFTRLQTGFAAEL
jgi:ABC-2 type transport system permease protein